MSKFSLIGFLISVLKALVSITIWKFHISHLLILYNFDFISMVLPAKKLDKTFSNKNLAFSYTFYKYLEEKMHYNNATLIFDGESMLAHCPNVEDFLLVELWIH